LGHFKSRRGNSIVPDTAPRRVFVFDRIDANRRNTLILSGICGIALIPVVGLLSSYLPIWVLMFLPGLTGFMEEARTGAPIYIGLAVLIASALLAGALYLQYRYADRIALRMSRARLLGRDQEKRLWDTVEGLCLGTGLPLPKLHVVETEVPNAFSVGLDPARSSLVVTRGLLSTLTPLEMEGVLAHEISHIGNQDIRLNTMVTAMGTVLRLPLRLLTAPFRFLFHLHWAFGMGALLVFGWMVMLLPDFSDLRIFDELDPSGWLRTILLVQAGVLFHAFVIAPLIGLLFPLAVSRQRELLADADAALLTRNPPSLARALAKIAGAGNGPMKGSHAMAHLYIAEPRGAARWWNGMFSAHPPVRERIELLAGMGDGILPENGEGRAGEGGESPGDLPVTPETPTGDTAAPGGEAGVGFLDASLYGIAAGTVAIAVLAVANSSLMLLGSGGYRPTGLIVPFNLPGALAAGFSARKRGTAVSIALGFALLVFLFHWIFLAPMLPFMPDPGKFPLRWIVWTLATDFTVVAITAVAGASIDRWTGWLPRNIPIKPR
jgi:heat shock protein HtpX